MQKFYSLSQSCEKLLEIKKSRFLGFGYYVENISEINQILENIKRNNTLSTHVCYAYEIEGNSKYFDDGEPSGTAGKPIYEIIKKKNIFNVLIVVVRYFGGIKLGAGGLNRAYSNCAKSVVDNNLTEYLEYKIYEVNLALGKEVKVFEVSINNFNHKIINKTYGEKANVIVAINSFDEEKFLTNQKLNNLNYKFIKTEFLK